MEMEKAWADFERTGTAHGLAYASKRRSVVGYNYN